MRSSLPYLQVAVMHSNIMIASFIEKPGDHFKITVYKYRNSHYAEKTSYIFTVLYIYNLNPLYLER